ncbi:MAG: MotA/TolQ/ExbB proton channel family protein [Saprospiraceae bacterium]|jgi:biopolymer transport protein ExbB|uniref:MotA/TolQ/ExbB proton channel family protein n=1 Tax=Candidatus Defluviibacterium haderslevense TaxID=2981993 RepID=A0A9D7SBB8_9BACT|nr:MotA/TolQ/ExbB proton channel family protein [Candidatus Defluviibacterium haderslevense]MBK8245625.1 MotA/TolQ/ExbB proton channel family protein [Candidatus Defluviibacterium haderslevense]MBK9718084.1 MotA/TolQ/ExbB proton channel family protein [Candidatus Defluviibacterium haderslevense]MCC7026278.1 MotA/TolQ/ExbB proton channel family protein [Saprospiraceae bacterium]MCI1267751.1 MotA/TolQ/ExbB proton channel family protein [Saprospiraceae bacterium]
MFLSIFLQVDTATTGTSVASQSVFDIILNSGPLGITIISIQVLLVFIALYIFIERYFTISAVVKEDQRVMQNLRSNIGSGNISTIQSICASSDTPLARMIEKGLQRLGRPMPEIESAIESVGRVETFRLEKKLNHLSLIARLAPMFGFLGTIMGVIKIFYDISLTDNLSIGVISGGLYQKMLTSAGGLLVGIIAFVGYYFLTMMLDEEINELERSSIEFMDMLHTPVK